MTTGPLSIYRMRATADVSLVSLLGWAVVIWAAAEIGAALGRMF